MRLIDSINRILKVFLVSLLNRKISKSSLFTSARDGIFRIYSSLSTSRVLRSDLSLRCLPHMRQISEVLKIREAFYSWNV